MFDSQQYLFKPFIYQFTTVPFKPFIYRFTTVIKYDPQNLQNLEFPIPFRPLFNSQWYMFLKQLFDSQQYTFIVNYPQLLDLY